MPRWQASPAVRWPSRPADASWDAQLRPAMEQHIIRVDKELMLPDLIADLAAAPGPADP
jgi:hypothetical protein